ncbi:MFS transporter [Thermomonospora curvata]|uniref:Major facilitator superfamily MFS_1 n=1 Tax=Thermomonospora curvata (strain ATCC 19995 / DSM 43183 / JCM 3096 / KCTC 9072 / NBRC 15933 / NCIMB 10081 / Henssen B9) TaxID=471852 RepID=D1AEJ1_THECD|nr:MFS transporter [Thermomonospora curvata]ACY95807.1 major facilitator superfamily MFS_1 [Thermomonospora curvata DSM 43183]
MTTAPLADAPPSPLRGWCAASAVALGIFALMTSELLPVGLLSPIGRELGVSEGTAGLMVTVPGLVAVVSAPLLTVAAGRLDRRIVLAALVGTVGTANLLSALAEAFALILLARVLIGVAVGGFWALAGGIATRLVRPEDVPRATAVIFGGVEAASVLGVPAGTLLGDLGGWRTAFAAVGALGLAALAGLVLLLPPLPPQRSITFADLPRAFRANAGLRVGLALTFLIVTGHFLAYTFVRPVLSGHDVPDETVGVLLLVFGVAGLCGNFLAGALIGRRLAATVVAICLTLAAATALVALSGDGVAAVAGPLVLWGLGYGAVPVTLQTWIMRSSPTATEASTSLYTSMFNLSIALGALAGGLVVDTLALTAVLWAGGAMALAALPFAIRGAR